MKIIIWGRSSIDNDNAHKEQIKKFGPPLILLEGEGKKVELLTDSTLIINHDGGLQKPQNTWQINTGGGSMKNEPPVEISKPGKIHWNTFIENLETFFNHVKNKSELTKEDLGLLYAIDPKIEELLLPFSNISPINSDLSRGMKLNKQKSELNEYIKTYLTMRLF